MLAEGISRRPLALAALAERRLHEGYLGRAASFYGWGIAVSYALLIIVAPASAWALVARALVTGACIVGALAAAAAVRDALADPERDALAALARETGFGTTAVQAARAAGAVWRAVRALAAPSIALAALALAASVGGHGS